MAYHHGYTPQHTSTMLLHLTLIAKLITSCNAALKIHIVGSACSLAAMAYHLVLATACESPPVSMMLDTYWPNWLAQLRMPYGFTMCLLLTFAASW